MERSPDLAHLGSEGAKCRAMPTAGLGQGLRPTPHELSSFPSDISHSVLSCQIRELICLLSAHRLSDKLHLQISAAREVRGSPKGMSRRHRNQLPLTAFTLTSKIHCASPMGAELHPGRRHLPRPLM